jgi:hypothetical protein
MPHGLHGWRKDRPSAKDWHAGKLLGAAPPPPDRASLVPRMLDEVFDQHRNDCTGNGVGRGFQLALTPVGGPCGPRLSRNWLYFEGGVPEGSQKLDDGRMLRDVLDAAAALGVPHEAFWPYDDALWNVRPSLKAFRQAFDFKPSYYRIVSSGEIQRQEISTALAAGHPIVVGAPVTLGWEDQDGVHPFDSPKPGDAVAGGHAFCLVGYEPEGVRLLNSWSSTWGLGGYGFVTWDWIASQLEDVWVLTVDPETAP